MNSDMDMNMDLTDSSLFAIPGGTPALVVEGDNGSSSLEEGSEVETGGVDKEGDCAGSSRDKDSVGPFQGSVWSGN